MRNVLLVGAGTMGRTHAQAYAAMDDVRLVGIADPDPGAEAFARERKAAWHSSLEEALRNPDSFDLVDVCVPTHLHKECVRKAAEAGKDVICEKPLAGSLRDAREMIDFCGRQGVRLFVGHVLRFFPEYRLAKEMVDRGEAGQPAVVRASRLSGFPRGRDDWYADPGKSGGVPLDLIIHDFDFLRWCFGEADRVYAKGVSGDDANGKDYALVAIRFRNGVIAHVEGSWAHRGFAMRLEIAGTEGIVDYDSVKDSPLVLFQDRAAGGRGGVAVPESPLKESPYFTELRHFIDCLDSGREPLVSAEDAYRAVELSLAAAASIRTGKPVSLPLAVREGEE